ncbi:MAG: dNTP triphosphohydrolase [Christensenellaceae bacterium]|nr:dNTP triphosphohydrolase [Christensenellaceae bacterium]
MKEFIIVKALDTLPSLDIIRSNFKKDAWGYHNLITPKDQECIKDRIDNEFILWYFVIQNVGDKKIPVELFIGECKAIFTEGYGHALYYHLTHHTQNRLLIRQFLFCAYTDLDSDYGDHSYISIQYSPSMESANKLYTARPYALSSSKEQQAYEELEGEQGLHPLAQKNQYCLREYSILKPQSGRGEFQRDYERIIHSKAFRRMVDKAQLFSAEKGDHYRTRMTHTLVVAQIARSLSKELNLNQYLAEAIALGHDLGHTPFGHQGERTLDSILRGKIHTLPFTDKNHYGGFKHNYQSLRVAAHLEEEYIEFDGLDLSFQTLDGMLKHTDTKPTELSLESFVTSRELKDYLSKNIEMPLTLEGQIVRIADEIAQRSHDLEDAFHAKFITIEELIAYLSLNKMEPLKEEIEYILERYESALRSNRMYADKHEIIASRVASTIIGYFLTDVVNTSKENMDLFTKDGRLDSFKVNNIVTDDLIMFSPAALKLCNYLKNIVDMKAINSNEVALFDNNGASVIESLFHSYYTNPSLLHKGTLRRILKEIRSDTCNVIDFENSDPKLVKREWRLIVKGKPDGEGFGDEKEYMIKNRILVRGIIDFIAGMTDSYAMREYRRIIN